MVQINGKYQLEKNEKLVEYLVAFGIPEDKAKTAASLKPILEIIVDGEKVSLNSSADIANANSELILNKEVDEPRPLGIVLKSTAKLDGDTLVVVSKHENKQGTRTYKFSDAGLVLTMTSTDPKVPTATRTYKRL